jgi:hypothetical protein
MQYLGKNSRLPCVCTLLCTQALQVKSCAYKSPALGSLFLMNNVHYVVLTVEQSEQLSHLGHSWVEKHKVSRSFLCHGFWPRI